MFPIAANIISFCHGCAIGWLSPAALQLESSDSPLETGAITLSEKSWIGSFFSIGAIIGNCVFGLVSNYAGRKNTLCILAVPNLVIENSFRFWWKWQHEKRAYLIRNKMYCGNERQGRYLAGRREEHIVRLLLNVISVSIGVQVQQSINIWTIDVCPWVQFGFRTSAKNEQQNPSLILLHIKLAQKIAMHPNPNVIELLQSVTCNALKSNRINIILVYL